MPSILHHSFLLGFLSAKVGESHEVTNVYSSFGTFASAVRFCRALTKERVSLSEQRQAFLQRLVALKALIQAVS